MKWRARWVCRFLFLERDAAVQMTLRRGLPRRTRAKTAVVIEDVITTGGSTRDVVDIPDGGRRASGGGGVDHRPQRRPGRCQRAARGAGDDAGGGALSRALPDVPQGIPVVKPGSRPV